MSSDRIPAATYPPDSGYPNEADALKARLTDRERAASLSVLVQVCVDVRGISRDPEIQKQGLLARMGAAEADAASMKQTYRLILRYARLCGLAAILLMVWVVLSIFTTWRNELSSAPLPSPPFAARVTP